MTKAIFIAILLATCMAEARTPTHCHSVTDRTTETTPTHASQHYNCPTRGATQHRKAAP